MSLLEVLGDRWGNEIFESYSEQQSLYSSVAGVSEWSSGHAALIE